MSLFRSPVSVGLFCLLCLSWRSVAKGQEIPPKSDKPEPTSAGLRSVEEITASSRKSIVVITYAGRDGKQQGLGTGFVVRADGLIATNLHVIGEGRPITVQTADGKRYAVASIHASDRSLDLALIRVDAKNLVPLELGDSESLKEGQAVVAVGNPHGLAHSVVAGVVSGKREIEGRPMIQLAIPIERGNSGGPLLNMQGRVHGILTMKSLVTRNLGFAVPINLLKPLLKNPNPISVERWLTIGIVDPTEWTVLFDARWRQRGGRILVEGAGSGFGGRTLCLSQRPVPPVPYEVAVTVRLDDESGAAGLVFHADGGDKHYGFYPSSGQLRLTRFDGPDVFSWKILKQVSSTHYRPGDWNELKVRIEKEQIRCYVNNHLVAESTDTGLTEGKVGLAKFRETHAEFKHFQVDQEIRPLALAADLMDRVTKLTDKNSLSGGERDKLIDKLVPQAAASVLALREQAKLLEEQAAQLRDLAQQVHQKRVQSELARVLQGKEDEIDLLQAALLLAKLDNEDLDIDAYRKQFERMVAELAAAVPKNSADQDKRAALNKYLFDERGFHGSRTDYYNRSNSYLSDVIDDREGLPITLSVLYMELARRLGVNMVGIGLPGHFVVKHVPAQGTAELIDVFEGGRPLSLAEARQKVLAVAKEPLRDKQLTPVTKKQIVIRMLHNLMGLTRGDGDVKGALRYLDTILTLTPDAAPERSMRAGIRYQFGDRQGALEDVDWLLDHRPNGINLERVRELRQMLTRPEQ